MKTPGTDIFFIGFVSKLPKGLRLFLPAIAAGLIGFFALAALGVGATQPDPGNGGFIRGGPQELIGVLEIDPYPMVHVTVGTEHVRAGQTIMLSAGNKRGVQHRVGSMAGNLVMVRGGVLQRGELQMMTIGRFQNADGEAPALPEPEPLGRWRVTGEICDGKCQAGAMRPGAGLAHKACANMCLIGGVPPVFVATDEIGGSEFFLMADEEGGPIPAELLDWTGSLVTLQAVIERRGGILVMKVDRTTVRPAG